MKLTFLGTGAHDYAKSLTTDFRDKFDKDARRSSAMMIGERYLIDCGDHILDELRIARRDASKITDIFNTHQHGDHYNIENARAIAKSGGRIRLWVREGSNIPDSNGIEVVYMTPFARYEVAEGVFVTGMPANHDPATNPAFYLRNRGKEAFLRL